MQPCDVCGNRYQVDGHEFCDCTATVSIGGIYMPGRSSETDQVDPPSDPPEESIVEFTTRARFSILPRAPESSSYFGRSPADRQYWEQYDEEHDECPDCGSTEIHQTTAPRPSPADPTGRRDMNSADCQVCDWSGIADDLQPPGTYEPPTLDFTKRP